MSISELQGWVVPFVVVVGFFWFLLWLQQKRTRNGNRSPGRWQPTEHKTWHGDFRPKPTYYRGILMRSANEAKGHEWLDDLGEPWEYEKEWFNVGPGLNYLPDDWLPRHGHWLEWKPEGMEPTAEEKAKAAGLAAKTGYGVLISCGTRGNATTYWFPGRKRPRCSEDGCRLGRGRARNVRGRQHAFA